MNLNAEVAIRTYQRILDNNRKYYERNKAEIAEKRRIKYRDEHPNPRPVGRPRKVVEERPASPTESLATK